MKIIIKSPNEPAAILLISTSQSSQLKKPSKNYLFYTIIGGIKIGH